MTERILSLPLWECGLKFCTGRENRHDDRVTPLVGVWIEIKITIREAAEAWSLPLWECGLKSVSISDLPAQTVVTPLVGVWIEIL